MALLGSPNTKACSHSPVAAFSTATPPRHTITTRSFAFDSSRVGVVAMKRRTPATDSPTAAPAISSENLISFT